MVGEGRAERAALAVEDVHEHVPGRVVGGTLAWQGAGAGTTRGREDPVALHGTYKLEWCPYAEPAHDYELRVLTVAVG